MKVTLFHQALIRPRQTRQCPPFGAFLCLLLFMTSALESLSYDVVIYGGTPAGITAAIEAKRQGAETILLVPEQRLGGLTTSGLGATDVSTSAAKAVVGGLAREFYRRVRQHYQQPTAWRFGDMASYSDYRYWGYVKAVDDEMMWTFEPKIALQIFEQMLAEAGVKVIRDAVLDRRQGVSNVGGKITEIRMVDGRSFTGHCFIDATYEGDLMAAAGVSFVVGRESREQYGESLAGIRHNPLSKRGGVDAHVLPGDLASGLLPQIESASPGEEGAGDQRVMAYCYRLCLTDVAENRVDFSEPKNYDPAQYELLLRYIQKGSTNVFGNHVWMPNRKTDMNNGDPWFALNLIGGSAEYPNADDEARRVIVEQHKEYQQGFLWFLTHDPRVPAKIQKEVQRYGLPKDEFLETGHWPPLIYVRVARRMVGEKVMTEHNCRLTEFIPDPVVMAGNHMDSHQTTRYVDEQGKVRIEGRFLSGNHPFGISLQALLPKRAECGNLIVPVCLSASNVALGSIRMEPVYMLLGQSAGATAALAGTRRCSVQEVPYAEVRPLLEKAGMILPSPEESKTRVIDDGRAIYTGSWKTKTDTHAMVGESFHQLARHSPDAKAQFAITVPNDGFYTVRFAYRALATNSGNARVMIEADGSKLVKTLDLRKAPANGVSVPLGEVFILSQKTLHVSVQPGEDAGKLTVDALFLVPTPSQP